jgi:succinyl-CoA synthetase beta subunit
MDLLEYQARDIFAKHGVPVLNRGVADTPAEAKEAALHLGGVGLIAGSIEKRVLPEEHDDDFANHVHRTP